LFNVVSEPAVREAGPAVMVFVACFLLNIPLGIVQRVQMGAQEAYVSSLWMIAGQLVALAAVLAAIRYQAGLPVLVLALSGTPILIALLNGIDLFGRRRTELRPRAAWISWRSARSIMGEGGWFFALQIIATCHYAADNIIIARVLGPGMGPEEVSRYAVVMKLALLFPALTSMWLVPLWPAVSDAMGRRDWPWIRRTFRFALLASTLFNGLAGISLILFGRTVFRLWIGDEPVIPIGLLTGFGLFLLVSGLTGPMAMFMNGLKILRVQVVMGFVMAVASIAARIYFARSDGATGVIFSNAVVQFLAITLPSLFLLRRMLKDRPASAESSGMPVSGR
jgi:O-antigen/teichoic acid export membrane protein